MSVSRPGMLTRSASGHVRTSESDVVTRLLKTYAPVGARPGRRHCLVRGDCARRARSVAVTPITSPVRLASVPHNVYHPARRIPLRWSFYLVLLDEIDLICPPEVEEVNEGRLSFSAPPPVASTTGSPLDGSSCCSLLSRFRPLKPSPSTGTSSVSGVEPHLCWEHRRFLSGRGAVSCDAPMRRNACRFRRVPSSICSSIPN